MIYFVGFIIVYLIIGICGALFIIPSLQIPKDDFLTTYGELLDDDSLKSYTESKDKFDSQSLPINFAYYTLISPLSLVYYTVLVILFGVLGSICWLLSKVLNGRLGFKAKVSIDKVKKGEDE